MSRTVSVSLGCMTVGMALTGCATAPVQTAAGYANEGAHVTYGAAATGAHAVYSTGGQVYMGIGQAAKKPLHDLNMMQDPIPVVLLRYESKPYDLVGVNSCEAVLNQVAELDLALGPDLDSPKDGNRTRVSRGADAAAAEALDAATDAAEHFLPVRSVIKRVSGATRYENHVKHAVLAGTVRRSFLKAIGMAHNCGWPASPLVFKASDVAMAAGPWSKPGAVEALAIAPPPPLAVPAAVPAVRAPVRTVMASSSVSPTAPVAVVTRTVSVQTVAAAPAAAPVVVQRVVQTTSTEATAPVAAAEATPTSYYAPAATAASFAASGPAAPWASTPQH